jgi:uncharacterized NAD(P)/FAD-binding protein YdhS
MTTTIAVIGAGFSGTLLALHLLRRCPADVNIVLLERNPQFGRGLAFSSGNASHLLNVPAGRMSAFHDQPHHFLDWLHTQELAEGETPATEGCFVPRRQFGAYVRSLLNQELKRPDSDERLTLVRGDAQAIDTQGPRLRVVLERDRVVDCDFAALAIGNFPPEPPRVADASFYDGPLYRPDPWAADALTGLDPAAPVLLIGTGLTMADTVVSLLDQGHEGPLYALSRRGLLPHRHAAATAALPAEHVSYPTSLNALTRLLRTEVEQVRRAGGNWQTTIDALRPFTTDVWLAMPARDRSRFLRHLRPWWDIHRHRLAASVADRIDAARASGQLRLHAGRIQRYLPTPEGRVVVEYRDRSLQSSRQVEVARVINCSGPGCDYDRIADKLVRTLLTEGTVRPDSLRLGLDVSGTCALMGRDGAISRRLFAVGPVTKGAFWEMTAVPDIRRQCELLAAHLATLAKGRPKPVAVMTT